jgi:hypothetical protein
MEELREFRGQEWGKYENAYRNLFGEYDGEKYTLKTQTVPDRIILK